MKMMKLWMLVAVAALASACSKQDIEGFEGATAAKTIEFVATDAGGRTFFGESDGDNYPVLWQKDDQIVVSLNLGSRKAGLITVCDEGKSATFTSELADDDSGNYTFYAVSPADACTGTYGLDNANPRILVRIKDEQTPSATSCDPLAQVLYAQSTTTTTMPEKVELTFKHWAAYGCVQIKNLTTEVPISKIQLEADGYLAGTTLWRPTQENEADKYYGLASKAPVGVITLNTTSVENPLWFATLPVDLSGKKFTIRVDLEDGSYYEKTITFANGDGNFQAGKIAKFSVDFADVAKIVPAEPFQLYEVYKENGVAQGVVFWVSDDGQTAKITSLTRANLVWSTNPQNDLGATSTSDGADNTNILRNQTKEELPWIAWIDDLAGDGWYLPSRDELQALVVAYNGGKETYSTLMSQNKVPANLPAEQRQAQIDFEKILSDLNGDPINSQADTANGDGYWSSSESTPDAKGNHRAYYVRFGKTTHGGAAKKNARFVRGIKVVTR
nr:DUF1566 domain-containing protein [Rikenellaceae bacterium]